MSGVGRRSTGRAHGSLSGHKSAYQTVAAAGRKEGLEPLRLLPHRMRRCRQTTRATRPPKRSLRDRSDDRSVEGRGLAYRDPSHLGARIGRRAGAPAGAGRPILFPDRLRRTRGQRLARRRTDDPSMALHRRLRPGSRIALGRAVVRPTSLVITEIIVLQRRA
jgi:hypothetical protein